MKVCKYTINIVTESEGGGVIRWGKVKRKDRRGRMEENGESLLKGKGEGKYEEGM